MARKSTTCDLRTKGVQVVHYKKEIENMSVLLWSTVLSFKIQIGSLIIVSTALGVPINVCVCMLRNSAGDSSYYSAVELKTQSHSRPVWVP